MKGKLMKGILSKGKKTITLVMSMAMVVSTLNVVAADDDVPYSTIPAVKLKIEAPAAGNKVNYDVKQIGDSFDTSTYKVDEEFRYWYVKKDETVETEFGPQLGTDNNWQELDKDEEVKYQNDKTYCMLLKLVSSDTSHYKFLNDATKYTCNGNGKLIDLSFLENTNNTVAYLVFEFKCKEALKNINFIIKSPMEGMTPADTKVSEIKTDPEGALKDESLASKIDLSEEWKRFDEETEKWVDMKSDEEFKVGQKYNLARGIVDSFAMDLANTFDDLANFDVVTNVTDNRTAYMDLVHVNGKHVNDAKYGNFENIKGIIKKIQIVTDLPAAGTTVGDVVTEFVGEEKDKVNFSISGGINKVRWSQLVSGTWVPLNSDYVFEEGKEYKITVCYSPIVNYLDDTKTVFLVNGHEAVNDFNTFSYTFTSKPAITEINYSIKEPVIGDKADGVFKVETKPEGAFNKELTEFDTTGKWEESTDGKNWTPMTGDVFEEGKYYRFNVTEAFATKIEELKAQGYYFINDEISSGVIEDAKEYINGIDTSTEEGKKYVDGQYLCFGPLEKAKDVVDEPKVDEPKVDEPKADGPKEGTTVKDKKYIYKVTKAGSKDGSVVGEVEVTGLKKKSLTTIKISAEVTIGGVKYKVTSVGAKAFKGNKKIKKAYIGKNVKTIGANAFAKCAKLKKVIIKTTKLTKVGKKAFAKKGGKKITFKVPKAKKKAYKKMLKNAKTKKFVVK